MNQQVNYLIALRNGEPVPVDTFLDLGTQRESVDNFITLYPNEEDRNPWQN